MVAQLPGCSTATLQSHPALYRGKFFGNPWLGLHQQGCYDKPQIENQLSCKLKKSWQDKAKCRVDVSYLIVRYRKAYAT